MLKIYFYLMILCLLFSNNLFGQPPVQRIFKEVESYSIPNNYLDKITKDHFFFDDEGDTSKVIKEVYIPSNTLSPSQSYYSTFFYVYDDQKRIVKINKRRYNESVDLWITLSWDEFEYNDNGCRIKKKEIDNLNGLQNEWHYEVDDMCRVVKYSSPIYTNYFLYEYPDNNNSFISKEYKKMDNEYYLDQLIDRKYNERGDVVNNIVITYYNNGVDSTLKERVNEYDYVENLATGYLLEKNVFSTKSGFGGTYYHEYRHIYKYSCDGLVMQEDYYTSPIIESINKRTRYEYSGQNDCFESTSKELPITLFPNPSNGLITLDSPIFESGDTNIQIYTITGKLIVEKFSEFRKHDQKFNFSFLKEGIYILHLKNKNYYSSERVIIMK